MGVRLALLVATLSGCISTVGGNERALFYSARGGMSKQPEGPGWKWHLPWNHYEIYDIRWKEHHEQIHLHTKDGLHLDVTIAVVVRPRADELYDLHTSVGPDFYDQLVRPALFAAARDGGGQFNHLDVATRTHDVETAIHTAMTEHMKGQHVEIGEIAIQHFDLPAEVEAAANRTAASAQLIAAKEVERQLAEKESETVKAQRRGKIEADGLERSLRAEQELAAAEQQLKIEEAKRKSDLEKEQAAAEIVALRAEADAKAIKLRGEAISPSYLRLEAVHTLASALENAKLVVVPVGQNGLPSFFAPFLNPLSASLDTGK